MKGVKTILCFDSRNKIVLLQNIKTFLFGFAGGEKVSLNKVDDSRFNLMVAGNGRSNGYCLGNSPSRCPLLYFSC